MIKSIANVVLTVRVRVEIRLRMCDGRIRFVVKTKILSDVHCFARDEQKLRRITFTKYERDNNLFEYQSGSNTIYGAIRSSI